MPDMTQYVKDYMKRLYEVLVFIMQLQVKESQEHLFFITVVSSYAKISYMFWQFKERIHKQLIVVVVCSASKANSSAEGVTCYIPNP